MLSVAMRGAGRPESSSVARLSVVEVGKLLPELVICDIDRMAVDPLEFVRQLRFVLPESTIAIYTGVLLRTWGVACHLAGANCVLSKTSSRTEITFGLRGALRTGCFTDPHIIAP